MDIRPILIFFGLVLIIGSFWWSQWTVWLGAPMLLLGIVFNFIDKE